MEELVHIFMTTYNHKDYISKAIESVLVQKTNFKYKIIIGEDNSTDGTRKIVKKYEESYPDKIEAYYNKKNLGMIKNSSQILKKCNAKYTALIEGDDYWTDTCKLQKQVNFLESNPDYSLCVHNVKTVFENVPEIINLYPKFKKNDFDFYDIINNTFVALCSIVYRTKFFNDIPQWLKDFQVLGFHTTLLLMTLSHGKGRFLHDEMAVARKNPGGVTQSNPRRNKLCGIERYFLYKRINKDTNYNYSKAINKKMVNIAGYRLIPELKHKNYNVFLFFIFEILRKDSGFFIKKLHRLPDYIKCRL